MISEIRELNDAELETVAGGTDAKPRTNGDNPVVQVVLLAAKAEFYKGMWYQSNGWKP